MINNCQYIELKENKKNKENKALPPAICGSSDFQLNTKSENGFCRVFN